MRTPCSRCGGAKRGTGQGYCPKPECRAAVATAKAEAKAAAAKAKAVAKPKPAVRPKAVPMKRPAAAGALDAAIPKAKAKIMVESAVRKRPRSASLPEVGLGLAVAEAVAAESDDEDAEVRVAEAVHDEHQAGEDDKIGAPGGSSSSGAIRWPGEACVGRAGQACTFSRHAAGTPCSMRSEPGERVCVLCDERRLRAALASNPKKSHLIGHLRDLVQNNPDQVEAAFERIQLEASEEVVESLRRASAKVHRRAAAKAKRGAPTRPKSLQEQWQGLLGHRKVMTAEPTALEKAEYAGWKKDDERRRNKKFPGVFEQTVAAAAAPAIPEDPADDDEEEADWQTPLAKGFEQWAKHNSWFMCPQCHRLELRALEPADIKNAERILPGTKKCKHCSKGIGYPCPQPEDVPEPLRDLSPRVIAALRPLEIDCGPYQRASDGYRIHSEVFRVRWEEDGVENKIKELPKAEKKKAKAALKFLKRSRDTNAYCHFYHMHWEFLGNHGYHADKKVRRLPVNFMERVGLECCLWPHLYWTTAMTETYARSQDERRLQRPSSAHGGPEHRERKPKRNSAADIFGDSDAEEKEGGDAKMSAGCRDHRALMEVQSTGSASRSATVQQTSSATAMPRRRRPVMQRRVLVNTRSARV